jgi:hypothetical protein
MLGVKDTLLEQEGSRWYRAMAPSEVETSSGEKEEGKM